MTLDTHGSKRRHRAAIEFGTFTDADGRHIRQGYRYTCPRCGWISRTLKHRIGAEYHADRHALVCAAGKPETRHPTNERMPG